jgi:hypothetical protein
MASPLATSNRAAAPDTKRKAINWQAIEDVDDLKAIIAEKEKLVVKLRKEKLELKAKLEEQQEKIDELIAAAAAGASRPPPQQTPAQTTMSPEQIQKLQKSLVSQINNQMVYKPSLKHSSSRVSAEFPLASEDVAKLFLGDVLMSKATNGKKQIQVVATQDMLDEVFGCYAFTKSLRYGACLTLPEVSLATDGVQQTHQIPSS